jgi:hypothetical protein
MREIMTYGLVNGVNGTFKDFTQTFSKSFIYGYTFIIPKLETQQEPKICTFMNNSL